MSASSSKRLGRIVVSATLAERPWPFHEAIIETEEAREESSVSASYYVDDRVWYQLPVLENPVYGEMIECFRLGRTRLDLRYTRE